ncbi:hypothetical protein IZY60_13030 [Lutibacter sp. B2]|nr:hypothetical protein [Lutibacter sp. B2]
MFYVGIILLIIGALLGYAPRCILNLFGEEKLMMLKAVGVLMVVIAAFMIVYVDYPSELEYLKILEFLKIF